MPSLSYCELCGRQATEKRAVIIDGTVFSVCVSCSKRGKPYVSTPAAAKRRHLPLKQSRKIAMNDETVLSPEFPKLIREARQRKGLTIEQLGMQMSEKAGLLKRFEAGALKPDEIIAKKIERFLGVKLYVSISDTKDDEVDNR